MRMSQDRMKQIGGRCLDVALGVFLIAMLVVIWNSPRTGAGSVEGAPKKAEGPVSSGIGALTPIPGTITVSFCLQDETNPGNVVLINAQTGEYLFCCSGVPIASGIGTLSSRGSMGTIEHNKGDRRVFIEWDTTAEGKGAGTAIVQVGVNNTRCQITDKNMSNNTCQCTASPPVSPRRPRIEQRF